MSHAAAKESTKTLTRTLTTITSSSIISHYFSLLNNSPNPKHLKHIHANLLRTSHYNNVILSSKLVLSYSKHDRLVPNSLNVFSHMPHKNIFSYNIIIGEFSRSPYPDKSVDFFLQMSHRNVKADAFTFPLVLRACAGSGYVKFGGSVHGVCVKNGFDGNLFVGSGLVFMYVTFGKVWDAREVFVKMPERDVVLWTGMLAGYVQHQEVELGLELFREMVACRVELDGVVMVSLCLMCGQKGWLKVGKSVHGWCARRGLVMRLSLGNAVVDMYVKCADLGYAYRVFDGMVERDVISWSSIILGFGLDGGGSGVDMAFRLFERMCDSGVKPNGVTLLGVLSACVHGGLVDRARLYFGMMREYGVVAELKHYACMVDCLSRAGLLEEAERLIDEMPLEPDGAVLGALVGGCRVHRNFDLGERVAKKLIQLEPEKPGYYVLLSNIYAEAGRFDDAEKVRSLMKESSLLKLPGRSLVESEDPFYLLQHNQG